MKIFVGSLPFATGEDELRGYFEEYGEVGSVAIIMDKFTGKSRGFGFVEMADDQEAQKAIEALNGAEIGGRTLVVNQAEERKERKSNYGGGNNSGGYNRGGGSYGNDRNRGGGGGGYNKGGGGGYKGGNDRY
jgi:RNA recognition motif-containing protein